jgi:Family of unknown function (DUF6496)
MDERYLVKAQSFYKKIGGFMPRKYGKKSQESVKREMNRYKKGTAHSGPKHKPVKSREQAIAIALSKARKKGAKVPKKPTSKKSTTKKSSAKKSTGKKSTAKKSTGKRSSAKKSSKK